MKVLLVNGSPHERGCTYTALDEAAQTLRKEGIQPQFFWIGKEPLPGCIACQSCAKTGRCRYDDAVNAFLALSEGADGFVFGSPVYMAAATGAMTSFMDRLFYVVRCSGQNVFYLKPAAAVVSGRRAGTTAAFDQLNKYFTFSQMPVISSQYWNMVHGQGPEDVKKDLEGLQTLRTLARNMAWFLKCKEAGERTGVPLPQREGIIRTNFIRSADTP